MISDLQLYHHGHVLFYDHGIGRCFCHHEILFQRDYQSCRVWCRRSLYVVDVRRPPFMETWR